VIDIGEYRSVVTAG